MNRMTITRGRDIALSLDTEPLFGVIKLSVQSREERHDIREYLSAVPAATVPVRQHHKIELEMLSLFRTAIPVGETFTLRIGDEDAVYTYSDCTVTGQERCIRGDQPITEVFHIESHHMTKRSVSHDG